MTSKAHGQGTASSLTWLNVGHPPTRRGSGVMLWTGCTIQVNVKDARRQDLLPRRALRHKSWALGEHVMEVVLCRRDAHFDYRADISHNAPQRIG